MGSRHRDIQERALAFAITAIELSRKLAHDRGLAHLSGQLVKSASSIGANLEEAIAAQSKADFINKCSIALKEARETRYWLRLLAHVTPSHGRQLARLAAEAGELVAILGAIVKRARSPKRPS